MNRKYGASRFYLVIEFISYINGIPLFFSLPQFWSCHRIIPPGYTLYLSLSKQKYAFIECESKFKRITYSSHFSCKFLFFITWFLHEDIQTSLSCAGQGFEALYLRNNICAHISILFVRAWHVECRRNENA